MDWVPPFVAGVLVGVGAMWVAYVFLLWEHRDPWKRW